MFHYPAGPWCLYDVCMHACYIVPGELVMCECYNITGVCFNIFVDDCSFERKHNSHLRICHLATGLALLAIPVFQCSRNEPVEDFPKTAS